MKKNNLLGDDDDDDGEALFGPSTNLPSLAQPKSQTSLKAAASVKVHTQTKEPDLLFSLTVRPGVASAAPVRAATTSVVIADADKDNLLNDLDQFL
jgi:hypothetical protein